MWLVTFFRQIPSYGPFLLYREYINLRPAYRRKSEKCKAKGTKTKKKKTVASVLLKKGKNMETKKKYKATKQKVPKPKKSDIGIIKKESKIICEIEIMIKTPGSEPFPSPSRRFDSRTYPAHVQFRSVAVCSFSVRAARAIPRVSLSRFAHLACTRARSIHQRAALYDWQYPLQLQRLLATRRP